MAVPVATLASADDSNQLLDEQEGSNADEDEEADAEIVGFVRFVATVTVSMSMAVPMSVRM